MNHRTITVHLPQKPSRYIIRIAPGMMKTVPSVIAKMDDVSNVFVVTDERVNILHGRILHRLLDASGVPTTVCTVPRGEWTKSQKVVDALQTQLLLHGVRRQSVVLALGGGVVGDLAGYAAATLMRGIRYIHLPTTLLAQVDSSIGGKVGINHRLGKNLIGAFHQPQAVLIDTDVLRTLPSVEFRNGLAEIVKIAAALDERFFASLERSAPDIHRNHCTLLARVIGTAAGIKVGIVAKDEREHGLRAVLNLGHTIAHALEGASNFTIPHGQAVSIGLALEAAIAVRLGLLSGKDKNRLISLLRVLRLPTRPSRVINRQRFFKALGMDKKANVDGARFVLLKSIGCSVLGVQVPRYVIEEVL